MHPGCADPLLKYLFGFGKLVRINYHNHVHDHNTVIGVNFLVC
jgi:hypothetical protein